MCMSGLFLGVCADGLWLVGGFSRRLMSTHPVATVGFPAFVYGAGSALGFVCRPRGFVPLFLLAG